MQYTIAGEVSLTKRFNHAIFQEIYFNLKSKTISHQSLVMTKKGYLFLEYDN